MNGPETPDPPEATGEARSPRERRAHALREMRRDEILDAALRAFARCGYHQTRISDVIAEAGIARGTFYLYFESKSAIFLELLDRLLVRMRESVQGVDVAPGAPPMEEQLVAIVRRILDTVAHNRSLTTILVREAVGLDEEVDAKLREFYANLHSYIRESLDNGVGFGILRANLDTEVAATAILGSFKQVMEQQLWHGRPDMNVDRHVRGLLDTYLRGLMRIE
ncbi:MAG: TetR/AcrR family transcriptional regulator [Myxococcota bacterium]